jgi:predicted ATPase
MKNLALTATLFFALAGSALADSYRVTYSLRGSGKRITVQAETTAEARRVVKDLFPKAVVTGAHKVR